MIETAGRKQVFHVNYLKKFYEEKATICNVVIENEDDIEHY